MRIPRCRATVSEEIAAGHWSGSPGKAGCGSRTELVLTREARRPARTANTNPFSRAKEECRAFRSSSRLFDCPVGGSFSR